MKTKHQRIMAVARSLARVSEAGDLKVGAAIVAGGRIIGAGWNDETVTPVIHAEINALQMGSFVPTILPAVMYLTTSPCLACANAIIGDGRVSELYYQHAWWDDAAIKLLNDHGIKTVQVTREEHHG